jgi:PilZ domain-containing protein
VRRLRERQAVTLAVPTKDVEPVDVDCVVLLTESDRALLQTRRPNGIQAQFVDGVAVIGFVHEGRPVMLRGSAEQLTPTLFTFRVSDGVGVRQLRGRSRLRVRVPVTVTVPGTAPISGFTIDLSRSGAAIELREPPAALEFELRLLLPERAPLTLACRIVRELEAGRLAVGFVDLTQDAARGLESFILTEKARAVWLAA